MENNNINKNIFLFNKVLNKNAPLTTKNNFIKKYPYKPFLVLSIIKTYKTEIFSNEWLKIKNTSLVKTFYDYLTNDVDLFEVLKNQKSKIKWGLGFTNKNANSILQLIKTMPLKKLVCDQFEINKDLFRFNLNIKKENFEESLLILEKMCFATIKKCVPFYTKYSDEEIDNFTETYFYKFAIEGDKDNKSRPMQHIFRKQILDRDKKCLICCEENYLILEACHIKPHSVCEHNEKYDVNNGIVLCCNHHKLFDAGIFTFDDLLKLKISKYFDLDYHTYFRQFETCFTNINESLNIKKYLKYHQLIIFQNN